MIILEWVAIIAVLIHSVCVVVTTRAALYSISNDITGNVSADIAVLVLNAVTTSILMVLAIVSMGSS